MSGHEQGTPGDSVPGIDDYLESPGRFKDDHKWRRRVQYRCKRSHLLGSVVKLPGGYVLYTLRRESEWPGTQPTDMVGTIPPLGHDNGDFELAIGGCKCQPVRTRRLGEIWADIEEGRKSRVERRV